MEKTMHKSCEEEKSDPPANVGEVYDTRKLTERKSQFATSSVIGEGRRRKKDDYFGQHKKRNHSVIGGRLDNELSNTDNIITEGILSSNARIVGGLESLSEVSSKYTERSSTALRSPELKIPDYLPAQREKDQGKKTLVLDLDETLVHSSFRPPLRGERPPNLVLSIEWDNGERDYVFIRIRPHCFSFLLKMTQLFEVVIFTASVSNYALPLVEKLDAKKYGFHVLSRRQCTLLNNNYFKDLSRLGRDLKDVIMIDNSPQAYAWQPANGIPIESWFEDTRDRELSKLVPVLERLAQVDDVRSYIPRVVDSHSVNYYEAFRVLKAPREPSPLDSFLKSWRNIKKNAAALFSGSSVTEGSKEDEVSKEEEEKEHPQLNPPKT
ncbi:unnamed protein product [Moneuplotes crassus]|uniref:FCP1 homology domain-containing protein n=2 Tax=Euplotes crassus TaxID=5936 RepID=A0AAD2CYE0_EUPCR|nr:unnamed protein product [Moneuplotes crassus]